MDQEEFYQKAFARNLGLLSLEDQKRLRISKIAIAGMGGVGGVDLINLARIGIGNFSIADSDIFEIPNINRQYGANAKTFDLNKAEVMRDLIKDINPFAGIDVYKNGVDHENAADFLKGADVYVDGVDFFSLDIRRHLFNKARQMGIPAVTAAPLGFSSTIHIFTADGMSFDEYFDMNDNMPYIDKLIAFAVGLAPRALHVKYMDLNLVSLKQRTGPSLAIACNLSSALTATEAVNLILKKRTVKAAPYYFQFDPYRQIYKKGYMPMGNKNPVQRFKRWFLKRKILSLGIALE
ncbi:MAG: ThiF family adenylyltransferase [Nitrospirae bacterium]|nr:ThiF family adenylyltransferase [Nitrospirota bacterium]